MSEATKLTFSEYIDLEGVNWSSLKHLDESPAHYRAYLDAPRKSSTPAQLLGQLFHLLTLEPERAAADVAIWTGGRRGTNAHLAWEIEHEGKLQVREQDIETVRAMAAAVRAHPVASKILAEGAAEVSTTWVDPISGIKCKGRIDWLCPRGLVDLKSTVSTHPRKFANQAARLGYHGQLAHYSEAVTAITGAPPREVLIIAVEKTPPYDVVVYTLDTDQMYAGEMLRYRLLQRLAECVRADDWPGRSPTTTALDLPSWAWGSNLAVPFGV